MPNRPPHPGKTPAQRRVLDAIGCGDYSPMMTRATRDALLDAGLIFEGPSLVDCGVKFRQYDMPIPVHMQWCSAVAEDGPDDE